MDRQERTILKIIKEEYKKRLAEVAIKASLSETDVTDKKGNILLSQGLKVRHKKSGYEYTVDKVEGEGDDIKVYLRSPETPRIQAADSMQGLHELDLSGVNLDKVAGKEMQQDETNKELLVVSKSEFEKEYIVD